VQGDPLKAAHTKRRQSVAVLQITERPLYGGTATVEVAESLRV
jgi:hypothetical protein